MNADGLVSIDFDGKFTAQAPQPNGNSIRSILQLLSSLNSIPTWIAPPSPAFAEAQAGSLAALSCRHVVGGYLHPLGIDINSL